MTQEAELSREERIKMIHEFSVGDENFQILGETPYPDDLLDRWTAIGEDKDLIAPLTRKDLDRFFFSHAQLVAALFMMQVTIRALSHDEKDVAEAAYEKANYLRIVGDNNFRAFFGAIMKRSIPNG